MIERSVRSYSGRLLRGFLILFVMVLLVSPMHVQAASAKKKALNAYKTMLARPQQVFQDLMDEDELTEYTIQFAVAYVDKNKVPELFVRIQSGSFTEWSGIYTWKSGKVRFVEGFTNIADNTLFKGYYKKTGIYVATRGSDGPVYERIVKLKSGKAKDVALGSRMKRYKYWGIGNKAVSKKAYKKFVKRVSKKKKLTKFNWISNTSANRNKVFGGTSTTTPTTKTKKVTQYRYSDKMYTNSTASSLSGWTRYDSDVVYGAWGNWSGWSTTAQTGSDTKQVQTRAEYRYYCFYCPKCGGREPLQGASDCHQYNLTLSDGRVKWSPIAYKDCISYPYSYANYKRYTESLGDGLRWNFSAGNLNSTAVGTKDTDSDAVVIRRAYRYQTRSKYTIYKYYKWCAWSPWSTTKYTATSNRKVETRTITVAA